MGETLQDLSTGMVINSCNLSASQWNAWADVFNIAQHGYLKNLQGVYKQCSHEKLECDKNSLIFEQNTKETNRHRVTLCVHNTRSLFLFSKLTKFELKMPL